MQTFLVVIRQLRRRLLRQGAAAMVVLFGAGALAASAWGHVDTPTSTPAAEGAAGHGTHQHSFWQVPPAAYRDRRSPDWADIKAIERGQEIYSRNCASCHGADGTGRGPAAAALAHKPADLTHHFHRAPGQGDAYLFWRVSEGGAVEPFRSMHSAMPAFKTILDERQRWDVLAYVHAYFHLGLANWSAARVARSPEAGSGHVQEDH